MAAISEVSEYKSLLNMLETSSQDDIYQQLMQKEKTVLDTINIVANTENVKRTDARIIYNKSVLEVIALFANTWHNIFKELVVESNGYKNVIDILWTGDRKIYVGAMIVLIALILFFIDISK